eukprot:SAG31_NODE_3627_length_4053_cov_11.386191_1_plen_39_part_10
MLALLVIVHQPSVAADGDETCLFSVIGDGGGDCEPGMTP